LREPETATARARLARVWTNIICAAAGLAAGSSAAIALSWVRSRGLDERPDPAANYDGALERLARLEAHRADYEICAIAGSWVNGPSVGATRSPKTA
jgi:hypothetical protein